MVDDQHPVVVAVLAVGKAGVLATLGAWGTIRASVLAVGEDSTLTVGTTLGVIVAFGGLLVRQIVVQQKAVWAIVRSKDSTIAELRAELAETRWEREVARFEAGQRPTHPGDFIRRHDDDR